MINQISILLVRSILHVLCAVTLGMTAYGDIESPDCITATDPGKYFNNCSILDTVLKDAFLCGGLLEMCTFNNSELNEANFDNAKISGCRFVRTKIKRSSFQEASLEKNGSVPRSKIL